LECLGTFAREDVRTCADGLRLSQIATAEGAKQGRIKKTEGATEAGL